MNEIKFNKMIRLMKYVNLKLQLVSEVHSKYFALNNKIQKRILSELTYNNNIQTENEYAHNVLLNNPVYSKTTVNSHKLRIDTIKLKNNSTLDGKYLQNIFNIINIKTGISKNFNIYAYNSDVIVKNTQDLRNYMMDNVYKISNDKLLEILLNVIATLPYDDNKVEVLFDLLLKECVQRSKFWSVGQILLCADIWYISKAHNSLKYISFAVKKLYSDVQKMNDQQFIQSFFYLNLFRRFSFDKQQALIEKKIGESVDFIGAEELGIIAMGLFKTKNFINDISLLRKFTDLLILHKMSISNISLCSVFKLLKQSFNGFHTDHYLLCSKVMLELKSEVKKMNYYTLIQFASLGNHLNLYEEELLNLIVNELLPVLTSVRLKELERLSFVLMNSRVKLTNFLNICSLIEKELQSSNRQEEINFYFYSFLSCVYYLAYMGHYNVHLISRALKLNDLSIVTDENRKALIQKHLRFRHLYELDQMLQIEGPEDYKGHRLSNQFSESLSEKFDQGLQSGETFANSQKEKTLLELTAMLSELIGNKYLYVAEVIPHSSLTSIIFCTDKAGNFQEFPHNLFSYSTEAIKFKPEGDLVWNAVILLSRDAFICNKNMLRGLVAFKIQLIERLGYNVIIVDHSLWDFSMKKHELLKLIKKSINKE